MDFLNLSDSVLQAYNTKFNDIAPTLLQKELAATDTPIQKYWATKDKVFDRELSIMNYQEGNFISLDDDTFNRLLDDNTLEIDPITKQPKKYRFSFSDALDTLQNIKNSESKSYYQNNYIRGIVKDTMNLDFDNLSLEQQQQIFDNIYNWHHGEYDKRIRNGNSVEPEYYNPNKIYPPVDRSQPIKLKYSIRGEDEHGRTLMTAFTPNNESIDYAISRNPFLNPNFDVARELDTPANRMRVNKEEERIALKDPNYRAYNDYLKNRDSTLYNIGQSSKVAISSAISMFYNTAASFTDDEDTKNKLLAKSNMEVTNKTLGVNPYWFNEQNQELQTKSKEFAEYALAGDFTKAGKTLLSMIPLTPSIMGQSLAQSFATNLGGATAGVATRALLSKVISKAGVVGAVLSVLTNAAIGSLTDVAGSQEEFYKLHGRYMTTQEYFTNAFRTLPTYLAEALLDLIPMSVLAKKTFGKAIIESSDKIWKPMIGKVAVTVGGGLSEIPAEIVQQTAEKATQIAGDKDLATWLKVYNENLTAKNALEIAPGAFLGGLGINAVQPTMGSAINLGAKAVKGTVKTVGDILPKIHTKTPNAITNDTKDPFYEEKDLNKQLEAFSANADLDIPNTYYNATGDNLRNVIESQQNRYSKEDIGTNPLDDSYIKSNEDIYFPKVEGLNEELEDLYDEDGHYYGKGEYKENSRGEEILSQKNISKVAKDILYRVDTNSLVTRARRLKTLTESLKNKDNKHNKDWLEQEKNKMYDFHLRLEDKIAMLRDIAEDIDKGIRGFYTSDVYGYPFNSDQEYGTNNDKIDTPHGYKVKSGTVRRFADQAQYESDLWVLVLNHYNEVLSKEQKEDITEKAEAIGNKYDTHQIIQDLKNGTGAFDLKYENLSDLEDYYISKGLLRYKRLSTGSKKSTKVDTTTNVNTTRDIYSDLDFDTTNTTNTKSTNKSTKTTKQNNFVSDSDTADRYVNHYKAYNYYAKKGNDYNIPTIYFKGKLKVFSNRDDKEEVLNILSKALNAYTYKANNNKRYKYSKTIQNIKKQIKAIGAIPTVEDFKDIHTYVEAKDSNGKSYFFILKDRYSSKVVHDTVIRYNYITKTGYTNTISLVVDKVYRDKTKEEIAKVANSNNARLLNPSAIVNKTNFRQLLRDFNLENLTDEKVKEISEKPIPIAKKNELLNHMDILIASSKANKHAKTETAKLIVKKHIFEEIIPKEMITPDDKGEYPCKIIVAQYVDDNQNRKYSFIADKSNLFNIGDKLSHYVRPSSNPNIIRYLHSTQDKNVLKIETIIDNPTKQEIDKLLKLDRAAYLSIDNDYDITDIQVTEEHRKKSYARYEQYKKDNEKPEVKEKQSKEPKVKGDLEKQHEGFIRETNKILDDPSLSKEEQNSLREKARSLWSELQKIKSSKSESIDTSTYPSKASESPTIDEQEISDESIGKEEISQKSANKRESIKSNINDTKEDKVDTNNTNNNINNDINKKQAEIEDDNSVVAGANGYINIYAASGDNIILSNLAYTPIKINNEWFTSVEDFYQTYKHDTNNPDVVTHNKYIKYWKDKSREEKNILYKKIASSNSVNKDISKFVMYRAIVSKLHYLYLNKRNIYNSLVSKIEKAKAKGITNPITHIGATDKWKEMFPEVFMDAYNYYINTDNIYKDKYSELFSTIKFAPIYNNNNNNSNNNDNWTDNIPDTGLEFEDDISETQENNSMSMIPTEEQKNEYRQINQDNNVTLHSGGAEGSDTLWGIIANHYGINVKHYYARTKTPRGNIEISNPKELQKGYEELKKIIHFNSTYSELLRGVDSYTEALKIKEKNLGRNLPLLVRDYYQIYNRDTGKYIDQIFAISKIKDSDRSQVDGGTNYAIQMAINNRVPEIYVYDVYSEKPYWYKFNYDTNAFEYFRGTPIITSDNFTGIGTRMDIVKEEEKRDYNKHKASNQREASILVNKAEKAINRVFNLTIQYYTNKDKYNSYQLHNKHKQEESEAKKQQEKEKKLENIASAKAISENNSKDFHKQQLDFIKDINIEEIPTFNINDKDFNDKLINFRKAIKKLEDKLDKEELESLEESADDNEFKLTDNISPILDKSIKPKDDDKANLIDIPSLNIELKYNQSLASDITLKSDITKEEYEKINNTIEIYDKKVDDILSKKPEDIASSPYVTNTGIQQYIELNRLKNLYEKQELYKKYRDNLFKQVLADFKNQDHITYKESKKPNDVRINENTGEKETYYNPKKGESRKKFRFYSILDPKYNNTIKKENNIIVPINDDYGTYLKEINNTINYLIYPTLSENKEKVDDNEIEVEPYILKKDYATQLLYNISDNDLIINRGYGNSSIWKQKGFDSINEVVLKAMYLAVVDYLATANFYPNTTQEQASLFGISESKAKTGNTAMLSELAIEYGIPQTTVANKIGKQILNILGIVPNKETGIAYTYDKVATSLGNMAIIYMEDKGLCETKFLPRKKLQLAIGDTFDKNTDNEVTNDNLNEENDNSKNKKKSKDLAYIRSLKFNPYAIKAADYSTVFKIVQKLGLYRSYDSHYALYTKPTYYDFKNNPNYTYYQNTNEVDVLPVAISEFIQKKAQIAYNLDPNIVDMLSLKIDNNKSLIDLVKSINFNETDIEVINDYIKDKDKKGNDIFISKTKNDDKEFYEIRNHPIIKNLKAYMGYNKLDNENLSKDQRSSYEGVNKGIDTEIFGLLVALKHSTNVKDITLVNNLELLKLLEEEKNKGNISEGTYKYYSGVDDLGDKYYFRLKKSADEGNRSALSLIDRLEGNLYFNRFFSRNGREFMDSTIINPQGNKALQRFSILPKDMINKKYKFYDYREYKDVQELENKDINKLTKDEKKLLEQDTFNQTEAFTIAQAFDQLDTPDKVYELGKKFNDYIFKDKETALSNAEKLRDLFLTKEDGLQQIATLIKVKELKIENLGQVLGVLNHFVNKAKHDEKGNYVSSIAQENDSTTSGYFIRFTQFPNNNEKSTKLRQKVGIQRLDSTKDKAIRNMSSLKKSEGFYDIYKTTAVNASKDINNDEDIFLKTLKEEKLTNLDPKKRIIYKNKLVDNKLLLKNENTGRFIESRTIEGQKIRSNMFAYLYITNESYFNDFVNYMKNIFPEAKPDEKGKYIVDSDLRKLMKTPTMVFGYGAKNKSMCSNITKDIVNNTLLPLYMDNYKTWKSNKSEIKDSRTIFVMELFDKLTEYMLNYKENNKNKELNYGDSMYDTLKNNSLFNIKVRYKDNCLQPKVSGKYYSEYKEESAYSYIFNMLKASEATIINSTLEDMYRYETECTDYLIHNGMLIFNIYNKAYKKLQKEWMKNNNKPLTIKAQKEIKDKLSQHGLMPVVPLIFNPYRGNTNSINQWKKDPESQNISSGIPIWTTAKTSTEYEELGIPWENTRATHTVLEDDKVRATNTTINSKDLADPGVAGGVTPIHCNDGMVMALTQGIGLSNYKNSPEFNTTSIYDAMIMSLVDSKDIVNNYNAYNFLVNKEYNLLQIEYDTINRMVKSLKDNNIMTDNEIKTIVAYKEKSFGESKDTEIYLVDYLSELEKKINENNSNREYFFTKANYSITNMDGPLDSNYIISPEKTLQDFIDDLQTKNRKNIFEENKLINSKTKKNKEGKREQYYNANAGLSPNQTYQDTVFDDHIVPKELISLADTDPNARIDLIDKLITDYPDSNTPNYSPNRLSKVKDLLSIIDPTSIINSKVEIYEDRGSVQGRYIPDTNTIKLSAESKDKTKVDKYDATKGSSFYTAKSLVETYVHELIHKSTAIAINNADKLDISDKVRKLEKLRDIIAKNDIITEDDFMPDNYDPKYNKIYRVLAKREYDRYCNSEYYGKLNNLNEFLAISISNDKVASKLEKVYVKDYKSKESKSWFDVLVKLVEKILNVLFNNRKLKDVFDSNNTIYEDMRQLTLDIAAANTKVYQKTRNPLKILFNLSWDLTNKFREFGNDKITKMYKTVAKPMGKLYTPKTSNPLWYFKWLVSLPFSREARIMGLNILRWFCKALRLNLFRETINELLVPGQDTYLLNQYNTEARMLETISKNEEAATKVSMYDAFDKSAKDFTDEENEALARYGILADVGCLAMLDIDNLNSIQKIKRVIEDENERNYQITKHLQDIDDILNKYKNKDKYRLRYYENMANQFGYFLATGKGAVGLPTNAVGLYVQGIYATPTQNSNGVTYSQFKDIVTDEKDKNKIINLLNELVSLNAIKFINKNDKKGLLAESFNNLKDEGIEAFLLGTNRADLTSRKIDLKNTDIKGNYKKLYNAYATYEDDSVTNPTDKKDFDLIYERNFGNKTTYDKVFDDFKGYYRNNVLPTTRRDGASFIIKGSKRFARSMFESFKELPEEDIKKIYASIYKHFNSERNVYGATVMSDKNIEDKACDMVINFDSDLEHNVYKIKDIYATVPLDILVDKCKLDLNGINMLAKLNAENVLMIHADETNQALYDFLKEDMEKNMTGTGSYRWHRNDSHLQYKFIDPSSDDPIIKSALYILPKFVLKDILSGNRLYIREDWLRTIFGSHNMSILNTTLLKYAPKIVKAAGLFAENICRVLASMAKTTIIVKIPIVLIKNIISNLMYSIIKGRNPLKVIKYSWNTIFQVEEYSKKKKRYDQLLYKEYIKNITPKEYGELSRLHSELKNNPVDELVSKGMYQTIVEDIKLSEPEDNRVFSYEFRHKFNKVTDKLPDFIKTGFSWLTMGKDTPIYRFMSTATQYSDFIARIVEYKLSMEDVAKKHKKGTPEYDKAKQEVLNEVWSAFVNYNLPQHPVEQYLNDLGFLWFTKFFKRIQHMIYHGAINNPAGVLMSIAAQNTLTNVDDIYDQSIFDKKLSNYWHTPIDALKSAIIPINIQYATGMTHPF